MHDNHLNIQPPTPVLRRTASEDSPLGSGTVCSLCLGQAMGKPTVGEVFGDATVLRRVSGWKCECRCKCGKIWVVRDAHLQCGDTKSCGCAKVKHGKNRTPIHLTWKGLKARCQRTTNPQFKDYGGRGIYVCDRWADFSNFYADMGDRPKGMTIDRIDNEGPYSPENCRWATPKQQCRNTRKNVAIRHNGMTMCMSEWAEHLGMNRRTLFSRLSCGWSTERALETPVQRHRVSGSEAP